MDRDMIAAVRITTKVLAPPPDPAAVAYIIPMGMKELSGLLQQQGTFILQDKESWAQNGLLSGFLS
jgi:hypothetical protein